MKYNKLVRNKIPDIIRNKGQIPIIRRIAGKEYSQKLEDKLQEEVDEFLKDKDVKELADVLEVVYAFGAEFGISRYELEEFRKQKRKERGSFNEKIMLVEVGTIDSLYPQNILAGEIDYGLLSSLSSRSIPPTRFQKHFPERMTNRDFLVIYHRVDWDRIHSHKYLKSIDHLRRGLGISSLGTIKKYVEKEIIPKIKNSD